uniref:glycosyltransferase n=1 Tax=Ningiella ruwaisensis TaxID=2364274 RepID=UPI001F4F4D66|nr:glycosyltransferase [Ningiella ruwaisensis]
MSDKAKPLHVLQFICSTGFYGAERWVLALSRNSNPNEITYSLATTLEENSKDLELVSAFRSDGGRAFEIPMSNKFDIKVVSKLVRIIKDEGIDVIHTHGYKSDILGVIAARQAKVPVVITPHGFENAQDFKLRTFIWLGCQAMRFADKVVPLSPQLMQDVQKYGIKEPKRVYIQNGVDLSEVDKVRQAEPKIKPSKIRIGFIGQMISRKNIKDILDIFDDLAKNRKDIELVLLGDGEERAQLEMYAQTLASRDDIHFLGYKDDRLDYLKSFDLFVMTSTLEGIPRCLMEACAMGIPVAAYDIAGIDQLITHQQTGLLAPLGNKQLLSEYWNTLISEPAVASKLAEEARHNVNDKYSAKRMANEYQTLFNSLVQNGMMTKNAS